MRYVAPILGRTTRFSTAGPSGTATACPDGHQAPPPPPAPAARTNLLGLSHPPTEPEGNPRPTQDGYGEELRLGGIGSKRENRAPAALRSFRGVISMGFSFLGWIVLVGINILAFVSIRLFEKRQILLTTDKVAWFALLIGIDTFAILGAFVVDVSDCVNNRTIACLLNSNRGVWTFGALCIGGATLYFNSRMKELHERKNKSIQQQNATLMISSAIYEIIHNL